MPESIQLEGLDVAPGVLETITALAAQSVDGVIAIPGAVGLAGLVQKGGGRGVSVTPAEDGALRVVLHLIMRYGSPLREIATSVQHAVADAFLSQTGQLVSAVDVFVDGVQFVEQ